MPIFNITQCQIIENFLLKNVDWLHNQNLTDLWYLMAAGALRLLDELPETVYRVCDLIIVVTNRNGDKWRDNMLVCLVNEVCQFAQLDNRQFHRWSVLFIIVHLFKIKNVEVLDIALILTYPRGWVQHLCHNNGNTNYIFCGSFHKATLIGISTSYHGYHGIMQIDYLS